MGNCLCVKKHDQAELSENPEEHKKTGNELFSKGKYKEAIECYKICIRLNPTNSIYYSNNAICFFKLKDYESCYQNAILAVKTDKENVKGLALAIKSKVSLSLISWSLKDWQEAFQLSKSLESLSENKEYGTWLREKIESTEEVVKLGQEQKRLENYYKGVLDSATFSRLQKLLKQGAFKLNSLQCPVSLEIFDEPLVISSGNTYDQKIITDLIRTKNLADPLTRERFRADFIINNLAVRKAILWFISKTPDPLECFN